MYQYKNFLEKIKNDENFDNGMIISFLFNNTERNFILLNNIDEDNRTANFMSVCPILSNIQFSNTNERIYNFCDDTNYIQYYNSNLYQLLEELFILFPDNIKDNIIARRINTLESIDFKNGTVVYSESLLGKLWIPSITEITGNQYITMDGLEEKQFDYFKKESNRIMNCEWWTRSIYPIKNSIATISHKGKIIESLPIFKRDLFMCFTIEI